MCILFLAINQHQEYPLIICANRDEYHQRPTSKAHFWPDNPQLLAGKDLQAGGSWLGINKQGYFAAITNIRTGQQQSTNKKSRGELVTMALENNSPIELNWLKQHSEQYNPFNLIYGALDDLYCYNSLSHHQTQLTNGFHAVSNGSMDEVWPKMAKGEKQLEETVLSLNSVDSEKLFAILRDQTQASDEQLPNTGIPLEWEKLISSIFICSPDYGTRSSSLLLQDKTGRIEFIEAQYDNSGNQVGRSNFEILLESYSSEIKENN